MWRGLSATSVPLPTLLSGTCITVGMFSREDGESATPTGLAAERLKAAVADVHHDGLER